MDTSFRNSGGSVDEDPVLFGGGDDTLLCGHCNFALAIAVDFARIGLDVSLRCPKCGSDNDLR